MSRLQRRRTGSYFEAMRKHGKGRRITFVIGSLAIGGAETQMALLAAALVRRGWEVTLFALEGGELRMRFESSGVCIVQGGYTSAGGRLQKVALLARAQCRLVALLLRERPQVLHAFLPLTNLMGAVAGKLARVPVVVTSRRALGTHQDRHRWWAWFDRRANACSTVVTVNSAAVGEDTIARDGIAREKMALIYNGLHFVVPGDIASVRSRLRRELSLQDKHISLVCVANLIPYKGHVELIVAFAALRSEGINAILFLVGKDRGIGCSLTAQADALGVGQWVKFLGLRSDVSTLLYAMDIGVVSSHEEGFSNALIEKLASGLPIVATSVGGNPEALAGIPDCVLVEPKSSASLLSGLRKTVGALSESVLRREVRSRMVINRYSVEAAVDHYERIYQVSRKRKRSVKQ